MRKKRQAGDEDPQRDVSETANNSPVYPKQRSFDLNDTAAIVDTSVSEGMNPKVAYVKRRGVANRIQNDETADLDDKPSHPSLDNDKVGRLDKESNNEADEGASSKVYAKRRKLMPRIQNNEEAIGVSETTNTASVYAKRRNGHVRIRNNEIVECELNRIDNSRSRLLPERHPNEDLFICDVMDAIPKDDMASMEHPMFSLATRPDMRQIHYEHNGNTIDITPSATGMATIHDKDILIYCTSQLVAKMNNNEPLSRTMFLRAHDLLVWSNRQTSGDAYARLIASLDRLAGTRIKTNIRAGDEDITEGFGLINEYRVVKHTKSGQMSEIKIVLSDWLFKMVQGKSVLTLHRNYFRLRKPLERRVYEIARKHCGAQPKWSVSVDILHKKSGSSGNIRLFRQMLRELEESNHLPDYEIEVKDNAVTFYHRQHYQPPQEMLEMKVPHVDEEGFHDAKQVAPAYDVYALYQEWGEWWNESGCPELRDVNAAFVGFCRRKAMAKPMRKT